MGPVVGPGDGTLRFLCTERRLPWSVCQFELRKNESGWELGLRIATKGRPAREPNPGPPRAKETTMETHSDRTLRPTLGNFLRQTMLSVPARLGGLAQLLEDIATAC